MLLLLLAPAAHAAEEVYGPAPPSARVHQHEATIWERGLHAERHYRAARWLRRGELVACGLIPVLIPNDVRRNESTAWLGTVIPTACSLGFGARATQHTMLAADLAYQQRESVTRFAFTSSLLRTSATAVFMATWGDFVSFGRIRDRDAEQRRRALLITSISFTLVTIPLSRAAWRMVHASIAGKLPSSDDRPEPMPLPSLEPQP